MRRMQNGKLPTDFASSARVRVTISLLLAAHLRAGFTDQPAQVRCETCADDYCEVCYAAQHRKGSRKSHTATSLVGGDKSIRKPITNGVAHAKPNGNDVRGYRIL
jgi:hypothetical protein